MDRFLFPETWSKGNTAASWTDIVRATSFVTFNRYFAVFSTGSRLDPTVKGKVYEGVSGKEIDKGGLLWDLKSP